MFYKTNKHIGIIGSKDIAYDLAHKYASYGYNVTLYNNKHIIFDKIKERIKLYSNENKITQEKINIIIKKIKITTNLNELINCDIIIESLDENLDENKDIFLNLDKICIPQTIFITTTSILNIDDILISQERKKKIIGVHYFINPLTNNLVEIIKSKETSSQTYFYIKTIQESLNKIIITSNNLPGFIINKFCMSFLNKSIKILEEKIANIATIEFIIKKYLNIAKGPFELMNIFGIKNVYKYNLFLFNELGSFYNPTYLLKKQDNLNKDWILNGIIDKSLENKVIQKLDSIILSILTNIVFIEKSCTVEECDISVCAGLLWSKGPVELLKSKPSDYIYLLMKKNNPCFNDNISLKKINYNLLNLNFIQSSILNNVGYITFCNPNKLNKIDENLIDSFYDVYSKFTENKNIDSIVLEGNNKSFMSGININFFIQCIENNNINTIYNFIKKCHNIFNYIENSSKLVICNMHGITLGGGVELALACKYLIGSPKTLIGFPETGMGIYPHLGGTQRVPHRIGIHAAKWMIFSGELLNAQSAYDINLIDEIVPQHLLKYRIFNIASTSLIPNKINDISLLRKSINQVFLKNKLKNLMKLNISSDNKYIINSLKKMRRKSPIALAFANNLIELSSKVSIRSGLYSELNNIKSIFSTDDAIEGLQSILESRKAIFKGH